MESKVVMLTKEERKELMEYTQKGVHDVALVRRARVILSLDQSNKTTHLRPSRICERIGISRQALCDIRNDFLSSESIRDFLKRKKRETPPVPPKVTGEVEAHIIALACSTPPEGYERWTLRLLAEKSIELEFIDSISFKTVQRLLKKRNINLI